MFNVKALPPCTSIYFGGSTRNSGMTFLGWHLSLDHHHECGSCPTIDNARSLVLSMRSSRHSREASSEASLWNDLDDTEQALANLATPLLAPSSTALARAPSPPPVKSHSKSLEHQLFPSIEAEQSRAPLTSASSHINGADLGNPWSQVGVNSTQFMREEWLASAALTQSKRNKEKKAVRSEGAAAITSKFFAPTKAVQSPSRQASSLLDKLDEICGSSPQSSTPVSSGSKQERTACTTARLAPPAPSRSSKRAVSIETDPIDDDAVWEIDEAAFLELEQVPNCTTPPPSEELTALDILNMSCSPPSQLIPHITLIKDMPEEQQQIYHKLAFSSSSQRSSQASTKGVTARGTKGKTWKATRQDNEAGGAASTSAKRRSSVTARKPRGTAFKKWTPRRGGKSRGGRT